MQLHIERALPYLRQIIDHVTTEKKLRVGCASVKLKQLRICERGISKIPAKNFLVAS